MISGDSGGIIKYWQPNMNNVKIIQGHSKSVRELSFSPSDLKFVSASDDQQLKVWDFGRGIEEQTLSGHIWEVRTVDWHPQLGMIASSGKDKIIKLWDPRSGKCLSNIRTHNSPITSLEWNRNGRWLLSGGRDHSIKLFDIRNIKEELVSYNTNSREIHSLAWHPIHETMFVSGGSKTNETGMGGEDGALQFWTTDEPKERACVPNAHASFIWSLAWHPMGHILTSGSNDHSTRFWARPRPGEYLPTELGHIDDVDARIFGDTINLEAAEQLACSVIKDTEGSKKDTSDSQAVAIESPDSENNLGNSVSNNNAVVPSGALLSSQRNVQSYDSDDSSVSVKQSSSAGGGSVPGLKSKDISRMLANIKKSGVVAGLPGLGANRSSGSSSTGSAGILPGLPGISRPAQQSNLPGLSSQQLQQTLNSRPARHPDTHQKQSSRFNPMQRNGNNDNNNNNNNGSSSPPPPPPYPYPPK
ncbi:WD repeat-containing protein 33 [Coemansia erecta]|nr:WD repeat-containing protein 33 [Coemansia erecta]